MSKSKNATWLAAREQRRLRRLPLGVAYREKQKRLNAVSTVEQGHVTYRGRVVPAQRLVSDQGEHKAGTVFRLDSGEARYVPASPTISARFIVG